jgi:hypothetical protein
MDLPENHCTQDAKWIAEQLEQLRFSLRGRVCERYSTVYRDVYCKDIVGVQEHQKEGLARFEANTRLRIFVSKYGDSSLGSTMPPPRLS